MKIIKGKKKKLVSQLRKRGYPSRLIKGQLQKVDSKKREDLLEYRQADDKKKKDRVPFDITYSSALPDVRRIVQQRMSILHRSERMKSVLPEPSNTAFKQQETWQTSWYIAKQIKHYEERSAVDHTIAGKNVVHVHS